MPFDNMAPLIYNNQTQTSESIGDCLNRYSMQCEIIEREGGNGGLLRDGRQVKDILARKIRLSWELNSMTAQRYAQLAALLSDTPLSVNVFDPLINGRHWRNFIVTMPPFEYCFSADGVPMSKAGGTLVLEEV